MPPIFYIKGGNLSFGKNTLFSNVSFHIYQGDKICLVGRNGSGKSSLLKVVFGEYELNEGELFQNKNISISYLKQEIKSLDISIENYFLMQTKKNVQNTSNMQYITEKLDLSRHTKLNECSGGELKRVFLGEALLQESDILLLDEPTNHLDINTIEWLENYIYSYKGAVICISHDKIFQEKISNKIWWLNQQKLYISEDKGFKEYDSWQEEIIKQEEQNLKKLEKKLALEKQWLLTGISARRKRNQKRLKELHKLRETAKIYNQKIKQGKERITLSLEEEKNKARNIIELIDISFKNIIQNFSLKIIKGEKIGIIGANGCGKSTLIKLLTKKLFPTKGEIKYGQNIKISYFDQNKENLLPNESISYNLAPSGNDYVLFQEKKIHIASYLKKFMFNPKVLYSKVLTLSGGEQTRLSLAKVLVNPGNLLILDEPTNDLDIDSLEILLEILSDYSGTLIVVSHNRDFLNQLVTKTIIFQNNTLKYIPGSYFEYLENSSNVEKSSTIHKKAKSTTNISTKTSTTKSTKLSYKYQRLLTLIPKEIDILEQQIAAIEKKLEKKDLFENDSENFYLLANELDTKKKILDKKLEQLLEIETLTKN